MEIGSGWKKGIWLIMSLLLLFPAPVHAVNKPAPFSVLIVYDSLAIGTEREGNVEVLKRLLASFRIQVTTESIDSYKTGSLEQYSHLIEVHNRTDMLEEPNDYVTDLQAYKGNVLYIGEKPRDKLAQALGIQVKGVEKMVDLSIGPFAEQSIHVPYLVSSTLTQEQWYGTLRPLQSNQVYPYGLRSGAYAYVPFLEKDTLSEIAITYLLKDWLQAAQNTNYYVVFKEVYPFSDLSLLERMSDELYEAGIPFIVSVRPVFSNTDYPAMKRYLIALKYVQSRNGTIFVNTPVVAWTIQDLDRSLHTQMEHFIDVLADGGVVPLGMGAEMYWSYDQHYVKEGMSFFDSAILYPNERLMHKAQMNTSKAFSSELYSIEPELLSRYLVDGRLMDPLPMDTALTFDFPQQESGLEPILEGLKNSWITFEDYKNGSHTVKTEKYELQSQQGSLLRNGERVGLQADREETSSDYVYKEQEEKSFETWFSVQNKIFIVIIFITLIVFSGFLIVGYRMYKRKYYK